MRNLILSSICLVWTVLCCGQAQLMEDINQGNNDSNPNGKIVFGQQVFFSADDGIHGNELWVTDGSTAGTQLFMEFVAGIDDGINYRLNAKVALGQLFFIAKDDVNNHALYVSDGTVAGTLRIAGFNGVEPKFMDEISGQLILSTQTGLVKTDGTSSGTSQFSNKTLFGDRFIAHNNEIYFSSNVPANLGNELYKTDGTSAGTILVKNINTASRGNSYPNHFKIVNGQVFFTATSNTSGTELWTTDGTDAGTNMVKDITAGSGNSFSSSSSVFLEHNNELFFMVSNNLWKSDGTEAGTIEVFNNLGNIRKGVELNGTMLLFPANDSSSDNELIYTSDGTFAGTTSFATGYKEFSHNGAIAIVGGELYFQGSTTREGYELWKTNGTQSGTVLVRDINSQEDDNNIEDIVDLNGSALFTCSDGNWLGSELYISDGTEAGTYLLKDINEEGNRSSFPQTYFEFGNIVLFTADDGEHGRELWKIDNGQASLLKDINPGNLNSDPDHFIEYNGSVYFVATTAQEGRELWFTDGTTLGTQLLSDHNAGNEDGFMDAPVVSMNNMLYFIGSDGSAGMELWQSDGTSSGNQQIIDLNGSVDDSIKSQEIVVFDDHVYFVADDGTTGHELWKSDGTAGGTSLVQDANPNGDGNVRYLNVHPQLPRLYYSATDGSDIRLWRTDGTNTFPDLASDPRNFMVSGTDLSRDGSRTTIYDSDLYFMGKSTSNFNNGFELWTIDLDGSVREVFNVNPQNAAGSNPSKLTDVDGILYFSAYEPTAGQEIWTVTGRSSAALVKDINPGSGGTNLVDIGSLGGFAFFGAENGDSNKELWISDGTDAGTVQFQDINPSTSQFQTSSRPMNFHTIQDTMYFTANNGTMGHELYKLELSTLSSGGELETLNNDIVLYPNPAADTVTYEIPFSSNLKVEVFDLLGQMVDQFEINESVNKGTLNIYDLKSGIYLLRFEINNQVITKKLMKN
ncbi:T9SS type A sorting domain-containing protein [Nonlabens spongiae]|nr:T9SS type A sorting domain-containing protein [Nonlabens spongiae]